MLAQQITVPHSHFENEVLGRDRGVGAREFDALEFNSEVEHSISACLDAAVKVCLFDFAPPQKVVHDFHITAITHT
jgi:hypothetical protein